MDLREFTQLLQQNGLPEGLTLGEVDRWAALRLQRDERTVRRWRLKNRFPHWVAAVLHSRYAHNNLVR